MGKRLRLEDTGTQAAARTPVQVVFEPPWNQQMMSEAAKLELGML